jgi:hypothetical protein
MPAGVTFSAGHLGHKNHFVAGCKTAHLSTGFSDYRSYFVALNDRVTGVRVQAVKDMDIRSAHPNALHLKDHLVSGRMRALYIPKFDLTWVGHDCLLHSISLL